MPRRIIALQIAAGLLAVGVVAAILVAVSRQTWFVQALTSSLSLWCGLILIGSGAALAAILAVLWRFGAQGRATRGRGAQGTVILEFALALPFLLMLVLVMAQSSLLLGGNICVHYSAYCAARSAIVNIPDDGGDIEGPNVMVEPGWSAKYLRIRTAALWAVLPICCGSEDLNEGDAETLLNGLREHFVRYGEEPPLWLDSRIARKLQYADDHTEVVIAQPANGDSYGENEDIRVRVRHTFYLSVPYAAKLLATLDSDGQAMDFGDGEYGMNIYASCRLTNEGVQDYVEEEMIE